MSTTQRRTGMLLGPDGWSGIDIGPTGAALLYLVLVVLVAHLARHGGLAFPEESSPAERQAWVSLIFVTLIALHFVNFLTALAHLGDQADEISNPASRRFGISL